MTMSRIITKAELDGMRGVVPVGEVLSSHPFEPLAKILTNSV